MSNGSLQVNYKLKWTWKEVVALLWHLSHVIEENQEKPVRKTSALAMTCSRYLPNTKQKHFQLSQLAWYKRICKFFKYTYLLTPWSRVLLEKLTGLQLVKKFPAFYGTRRFITALTSLRHPSLSWANPIQSTSPHPTSWRSILIL
jgi:hypothetical protein